MYSLTAHHHVPHNAGDGEECVSGPAELELHERQPPDKRVCPVYSRGHCVCLHLPSSQGTQGEGEGEEEAGEREREGGSAVVVSIGHLVSFPVPLTWGMGVWEAALITYSRVPLQIPLPQSPPWWLLFDADYEDIEAISLELLSLYRRPRVMLQRVERRANKLKEELQKKQVDIKEVKLKRSDPSETEPSKKGE